MIDLTDLDAFAAGFPHDAFTELRRDAPVWCHPPTEHTPGGEHFWVLSRHADVLAAAGDAATFSSEGGPGRDGGGTLIEDLAAGFAAGVLLNMTDDPHHQSVRRLVTPAVSPRRLAELAADLRSRTAVLVDAAMGARTCDLLVDVAAELPLQATAGLLGVPMEDRHRLFAWADATLDYDDRDLGGTSERVQAAQASMFEYGAALLADKRARPGDDLLSVVAGAGLPELEQQMFFQLLMAAGTETTRNAIAGGVLALVQHPEQWGALHADRALLPTAVEEVLRWTSPTSYNRRTATRDVEVGGAHIAAGDKVTLWWSSANRDEAVFDEPFRFDVARTPNKHLAFGHGSHFCLGAGLARLEIKLVLEALLDRVAEVRLAGEPEWVRSNKHTGLRHLPVELVARSQEG